MNYSALKSQKSHLIFIASANKEIIKEEGIIAIPNLLVEIIFPSSIKTDRFTKYHNYMKQRE